MSERLAAEKPGDECGSGIDMCWDGSTKQKNEKPHIHRQMKATPAVDSDGYEKAQLIEFHDTGTIIGTKFHNEFVGWFPHEVTDLARINADDLYAKVADGILSVLFYLKGPSGRDSNIVQTLTYKGNFTAWWGP